MRRAWAWLLRWLANPVPIPVAGESIVTRCGSCDQRHLFRRPDSVWIECSCGACFSEVDYVQLVRDEDEYDQRVW